MRILTSFAHGIRIERRDEWRDEKVLRYINFTKQVRTIGGVQLEEMWILEFLIIENFQLLFIN